ncbi:hypothetical protein CGRA01v4_13833 [Colletotrichum graminicola]|nr:hypothetical protein CGRA01v4_13833 [Colletotrichum graminicola]
MAAIGAEVENVHSHNGKITPHLSATIVKRAKTIVEENKAYYAADQFNNKDCIVLKAARPGTRVVVVEPSSAPPLSQGTKGVYGIEGIGPGLIPPLLDSTLYDVIRAYPEEEAYEMCRRVAKEKGILTGTSTGLNDLGPGRVVLTVACDTGLKYVSGNLYE